MGDLIGFKIMEEITPNFGHFHEAYKVGENLIAGCRGACWRLYTKEGYPLTRHSHSLELKSFGTIISRLGASQVEYRLSDLIEDYNGLKNLIKAMIEEVPLQQSESGKTT